MEQGSFGAEKDAEETREESWGGRRLTAVSSLTCSTLREASLQNRWKVSGEGEHGARTVTLRTVSGSSVEVIGNGMPELIVNLV